MGVSHLVNSVDAIDAFKVRFGIPEDIRFKYYLEGDIKNYRQPGLIFPPLMAMLEGGVSFPLDPF